MIKNLPENIPEIDAVKFLKSQGLENKGELKIHHNKKNTNIDVEDIGDVTAKLLIKNIHEQTFFSRKVYCRALLNVHTPPRTQASIGREREVEENPPNSGSPLLNPNIPPGLSQEDAKKAERKQIKENKKKQKLLKDAESKNERKSEKLEDLGKEDFLKDPTFADFTFDAADDISSDEESGFPWSKSPLESEDPEK